jgi:hypothetical protein
LASARRDELAHAPDALRGDHPELGKMAAQRIGELRALGDQEVAGPVQQQRRLLVEALHRHEAHRRPPMCPRASLHPDAAGRELREELKNLRA